MALILDEILTVDGNTAAITWTNNNKGSTPFGTVSVFGTFGGGTATFQSSPDNGTTFIDVLDQAGAVVAFTVNSEKNFNIASSSNNPIAGEQRKLRVNLAGSTSPSITVRISDSR